MVLLEIFVLNVDDRLNWFPVIKLGTRIAYLRNWLPFLYLPHLYVVHIMLVGAHHHMLH